MRADPEELLSDLMSISRWSWRVPAHVPLDKPPIFEIRKFSTMTNDLRSLSGWMKEYGVTAVAMESTGIYWKLIFDVLEDDFDVVLVNSTAYQKRPWKEDRRQRLPVDCPFVQKRADFRELYPIFSQKIE